MNLFDRFDKKVSERRDKEAGFVSLNQICLYMKSVRPSASWQDLADSFVTTLLALQAPPKLYRLENGAMLDVSIVNASLERERDSKPRSFEEMGRFMGTSAQTLMRKLNEESINDPKLALYGYQKADLKSAFDTDFTDTADIPTLVTGHEATLIAEIELLKSENARLQKALRDPHPNAERHATNREQILLAALYLLYNEPELWKKKTKEALTSIVPTPTMLSKELENLGHHLWSSGSSPLSESPRV
ncbi:hypothetical protein J2125_001538 [Erwinia toletana]|uniref:Uncharacterized protein n=1 Tax=Winslowiella toletana TaxID=92490 RepID=A0ABS4P6S0_9GAMM|nr:hypothetical protein [Winslowiella toletana]MBP2168346.1 hypothetical protein [Winslowiella toletana]